MRRLLGMSVMVALAMAVAGGTVLAAEGGTVRGTLVKRTEVRVGDMEFLAIVVRRAEGGEEVTLWVPRHNADLMAQVGKLEAGQMLRVAYGSEEGQKWVRTIEVARGPEAPPPPPPPEGEELRRMVRQLLERVERLEGQVRELREQLAKVRGEGAGTAKEGAEKKAPVKEGEAKARPEGDRTDKPRPEGAGREAPAGKEGQGDQSGELRGAFVKLVEKKVGELEYLGVVVRPDGKEEGVTLLVPKVRGEGGRWVNQEELAARARKLREGQRVEISWRQAEGQRWIQKLAM